MWCCLFDLKFIRFGRTLTCDRQTQTQAHSIYRASTVSCGKNAQTPHYKQHGDTDILTDRPCWCRRPCRPWTWTRRKVRRLPCDKESEMSCWRRRRRQARMTVSTETLRQVNIDHQPPDQLPCGLVYHSVISQPLYHWDDTRFIAQSSVSLRTTGMRLGLSLAPLPRTINNSSCLATL